MLKATKTQSVKLHLQPIQNYELFLKDGIVCMSSRSPITSSICSANGALNGLKRALAFTSLPFSILCIVQ